MPLNSDNICDDRRKDGLDIVRSLAITLVVVYHAIKWSSIDIPVIQYIASIGEYGVNLFFVLSGWLIGTILWKEIYGAEQLKIWRFWYRRWMRTIPPYFVALGLAWAGVKVMRGEEFDPLYLFFLQNYETAIPFFRSSWSLCVEEHFYVIAPLFAIFAFEKLDEKARMYLFLFIFLLPLFLRATVPVDHDISTFGYYRTATHFNFEGLALGVFLSYFYVTNSSVSKKISQLSSATMLVVGIFVIAISFFVSEWWKYVLMPSLVAIFCGALIIYFKDFKFNNLIVRRLIYIVAVTSYSSYLVHALCLRVASFINSTFLDGAVITYFVVSSIMLPIITAVFYFSVEKFAINYRDRGIVMK